MYSDASKYLSLSQRGGVRFGEEFTVDSRRRQLDLIATMHKKQIDDKRFWSFSKYKCETFDNCSFLKCNNLLHCHCW